MAALVFEVAIPAIPLTPNVAKTICQIKTPTNQRARLLAIGFWVDGTNQGYSEIQVRFLRQTNGGTSLVAATPFVDEPELSEAVQSTAQTGSLTTQTEPTNAGAAAVARIIGVPAFNGQYEKSEDWMREIIIGGGTWFGFEALNPAANGGAVNIRGYVKCEE